MTVYRYQATNYVVMYYSYDDGENFLVKYDARGNIIEEYGDKNIRERYYDDLFRMLLRVEEDAIAV